MSLFEPPTSFELSIDTLEALEKAKSYVHQKGGPQDLIVLCYTRLEENTGILTLEDAELLKVGRYAHKYGDVGTYQAAFQGIIADAKAAGWPEPDRYDDHDERPEHTGRRWDGKGNR